MHAFSRKIYTLLWDFTSREFFFNDNFGHSHKINFNGNAVITIISDRERRLFHKPNIRKTNLYFNITFFS